MQPLALTLGEPAGIGPDLALAVWHRRTELDLPAFYLAGDPDFLRRRAGQLGLDVLIATVTPATATARFQARRSRSFQSRSRTNRRAGPARWVKRPGLRDRLDPAGRQPMYLPVSTRRGGDQSGGQERALQLRASLNRGTPNSSPRRCTRQTDRQSVSAGDAALVSQNLLLAGVDNPPAAEGYLPSALDRADCRELTDRRARPGVRFGIMLLRLAVAGLNPHAGEEGTLGDEDRTIVAPAVATLVAEGIEIRGPLPADTMFHESARATYDAALCMYHDQVSIPIKTLAFDHAVNVTLGLPFVRTSPDHGTAFDIAGTLPRRCDEPRRRASSRPGWRKQTPRAADGVVTAVSLAPDGLLPLREVIRRHGLAARKSLGQRTFCSTSISRRELRARGDRLKALPCLRGRPGTGWIDPRAARRAGQPA